MTAKPVENKYATYEASGNAEFVVLHQTRRMISSDTYSPFTFQFCSAGGFSRGGGVGVGGGCEYTEAVVGITIVWYLFEVIIQKPKNPPKIFKKKIQKNFSHKRFLGLIIYLSRRAKYLS